MKAIVYLDSWMQDRPLPFLVTVPDQCTPGNCWQHEKRHHLAARRYVGSIDPASGIHARINERADFLYHVGPCGRRETADFSVMPAFWPTDRRTALSRYRNAKRLQRKGTFHYCAKRYWPNAISFGIIPRKDLFCYTEQECRHIHARFQLAATSRAPLPPWRLSDCWKRLSDEPAAEQAA